MNDKLEDLRSQWLRAKAKGDTKAMESIERIGSAIKRGDLCRQCSTKVAELDSYFCSEECQNKYYPPSKAQPSIEDMKKKLREMARDAHFKKNPQGRLDL